MDVQKTIKVDFKDNDFSNEALIIGDILEAYLPHSEYLTNEMAEGIKPCIDKLFADINELSKKIRGGTVTVPDGYFDVSIELVDGEVTPSDKYDDNILCIPLTPKDTPPFLEKYYQPYIL